jgi:hypothetical protein
LTEIVFAGFGWRKLNIPSSGGSIDAFNLKEGGVWVGVALATLV